MNNSEFVSKIILSNGKKYLQVIKKTFSKFENEENLQYVWYL